MLPVVKDMETSYSSSTNNTDTLWLTMKAKVKETRRLISQYGAKVPSSFTLWPGSAAAAGITTSNGFNGARHSTQQPLQLLFLCVEEPCSERTLFSVTIPTDEFHGSLPWTKLIDSTGFSRLLNFQLFDQCNGITHATQNYCF